MDSVEPTTSACWPLVGRGEELERCVEALTSGQVRAVFVHGPAGVGKTRLAEEVVGRITKVGRATQRVRASLASSALPLGAVAHLLPSDVLDRSFDPLSVYAGVVASLRVARAGRGPLVILVDDAQWLDQTSAVLFGQLLDGGELALVGTVRTGEDAPPAVAGLWRRDDVGRVDLGELTYADVDALLHLVLGGPVDHGAIARLWSASAGNPLFVRELVLARARRWRPRPAAFGVVARRDARQHAAPVGDHQQAHCRRKRVGAFRARRPRGLGQRRAARAHGPVRCRGSGGVGARRVGRGARRPAAAVGRPRSSTSW